MNADSKNQSERLRSPACDSSAARHTECACYLPRQELDDDVHIDRQAEIAGAGEADHRDPQRFGVERDPVGRLLAVAVADDALVEVVDRLLSGGS